MNQFAQILIGFFLTTVVGGILGFYLQKRSWEHQTSVQRAEREAEKATQIFDEISRLLDKRLYRMRPAYWSLVDESTGQM